MNVSSGQPSDPTGWETLELFADAPAFNRWLLDRVLPFCRGKILEVGSGIGNISALLLEKHSQVSLSDLRPEYCEQLRRRFASNAHLQEVCQIDLSAVDFENRYQHLMNGFNTVIALNVVEHIEQDLFAIENAKKLLTTGGKLIILVPAGNWLYNNFDRELGHFRRYSAKTLSDVLRQSALTVDRISYFNFAGIGGWWLSGSLLKKKIIPRSQLKLFDRLVPVFRLLDRLFAHVAGLSVIAVTTKKTT